MQDPAAVVTDHEEDVERPQGTRLHGEKVGRPDFGGMQAQKGPPGGRRRRPDSAIAIDRCGTHGVPQHSELGCDAAHAPRGILRCQPVNQAARLQIDPHPAGLTAPALPAPVSAPDKPMPPDDGRRLNALQMRTPADPVPRRDGPEPAVARLEPRSTSGPFPHRQLLAQNQVLEDQIPSPPAEHSQPDQKQSPIEPGQLALQRTPLRHGPRLPALGGPAFDGLRAAGASQPARAACGRVNESGKRWLAEDP